MEKHVLILTTTNDFLCKFEAENVKLLQQMGYTVHFASNMEQPAYVRDEERIREMGVWTHPIVIARSPFMLRDNLRALRQIVRLVRQYSILAIHCHTPVGGLLGRLAGMLCRKERPVVLYTAHGFHFYRGAPLFNRLVYYPVEKFLARHTDILIVINGEDFRAAGKFQLRKGGRLYRIPGIGLDREAFRPLPEETRRALRRGLGIPPGCFFLVSVGELNENKNHRILLEALSKMKRECAGSLPVRYGICGDGFFRDRLEQWIREKGLEEQVTLYGYRRNVREILGCADASALPSRREGLGMAGLESLAMGVPVLAADNRGTREYMRHGKNGFVCRYDDADGFARGIEALRNQTGEQEKQMRIRCRASTEPFGKLRAKEAMERVYGDMEQRIRQKLGKKPGGNQRHHGGV